MPNNFETGKFVLMVTESLGKSERTAKGWLKKMVSRGQLIKKEHGYYEKVQRLWEQGVGSSNLPAPTQRKPRLDSSFLDGASLLLQYHYLVTFT